MLTENILRSSSLGRLRTLGQLGWARGAIGALIGIALAGGVTHLLLGGWGAALPWLVAPLGASAVLVFAVPASPLAQPWPLIGGNLISAVLGLLAGLVIAPEWLACAIAVGGAVAVMALLRCLHPPGGACALLCTLAVASGEGGGWFLLLPMAANVLLLGLCGWIYNGATGHPWPHTPEPARPADPVGLYSRQDLDAVLDEWDELLDVDRDDLDQLFQAVERRRLLRVANPR